MEIHNDFSCLFYILSGISSSGAIIAQLYMNDQTGNFNLVSGTPFEVNSGGDFDFQDVNNDAFKDLILTGFDASGNGFTKLYLNDGTGSFNEDTTALFLQLKGSRLEFIDIENDAVFDLLLIGEDNIGVRHSLLYAKDGILSFGNELDTNQKDEHFQKQLNNMEFNTLILFFM